MGDAADDDDYADVVEHRGNTQDACPEEHLTLCSKHHLLRSVRMDAQVSQAAVSAALVTLWVYRAWAVECSGKCAVLLLLWLPLFLLPLAHTEPAALFENSHPRTESLNKSLNEAETLNGSGLRGLGV